MPDTPIGYTTFTYTRSQIEQLVDLYLCNGKRLSSTLFVALDYVFPKVGWQPVLEFLEKIQEIDQHGPANISPDDELRQWIALKLNPKLNPEWLKAPKRVWFMGLEPMPDELREQLQEPPKQP